MIYQFEDLELDLGRRQLSRAEEPIKLPKLSFDLLKLLVEEAPDLVDAETVKDKVWGPARVVTPENLTPSAKILGQRICLELGIRGLLERGLTDLRFCYWQRRWVRGKGARGCLR